MSKSRTDITGPVDPRQVDAELIGSLYKRTTPLLVANIGAATLLTIALWATADRLVLLGWFCVLTAWTMVRFLLARLFLRKPRDIEESRLWIRYFAVGSGVAGTIWGLSVFLVGTLEAENTRLVVPFVMAALSAAAIAGYSNSMLAFAAFITPALVPYAIRLIWLDGTPEPIIAAFVAFWGFLLWTMARHLNHSFRDSLALALKNAGLVDGLTVARDRAEAANLSKTRFLANMSHELRTPLNAIIGYSEMMAMRMLGPIGNEKYESYPDDILSSGRHLLHIVDQILDVSKLEAGAVDLSDDIIDVEDLVQGAIRFVEPAAQDDAISLSVDLPGQVPNLRGDATKVRQILLNLLSNAVKFTPRNGKVAVSAELTASGELAIAVEDTGIGIPPENIEEVVKPFARMENQEHLKRVESLKADGGHTSTGLGLPLVKLLSELHGATFSLASTIDIGTAARVVFPAERVVLGENVITMRAAS
ncbi:MAG: hypothetical protein JJ899_11655 [Alphaproteobacteria bacterium]|nr:hypothetical protein [Alphaproteobacteria bacterium]